MIVAPTAAADIPAIETVLKETDLFPADMLPDMIRPYLEDSGCPDIWLSCEHGGEVAGFCFASPEALTEGTWNMLAIAVRPDMQSSGAGSALVRELEQTLRKAGARILIADTSGTPDYARTREFYRKNGYQREAVIRDFWAAGADKVTFWKSLA
jgi:ribosomal protein S18 acetylase RimI-like enzyme